MTRIIHVEEPGIFNRTNAESDGLLVKTNKIKKGKDFEFVTIYKWVFQVKYGKNPNLHHLDNITKPDKCKDLFSVFIRALSTYVHEKCDFYFMPIFAQKIAFGKSFQFSIDF